MTVIYQLILIDKRLSRLGQVLIPLPISKNPYEVSTNLGRGLISPFYYYIPYFNGGHIQPGEFSMDLSGSETVLERVTCAVICTKCSGCEMEMANSCAGIVCKFGNLPQGQSILIQ